MNALTRSDSSKRIVALAPTSEAWKNAEIVRYQDWCSSIGGCPGIDTLVDYIRQLLTICEPATVEKKLCGIKDGFVNALKDAGLPAGMLDAEFKRLRKMIPKTQKEPPRIIDRGQYLEMLVGMEEHQAVFLRALWETGARVSELCGCLRKNVTVFEDRVEARIVGKGNKRRTILFSLELHKAILAAYPDPGDYLFHARTGRGRLNRSSAWRWVNAAGKRIGLEYRIGPHTFRHSYATRLIQSDVKLPIVQRLLGHSKLDTTMIYTHLAIPVGEILEASK